MRTTLAALAALMLVLPVPGATQPFAVQVGDARLALDAPPGFADTGFTGSPRLQELAESLTSASNRILLFGITDADLRRFSVGDTPEFRRYVLAVTPKGLERERFTATRFSAFVDEALREFGAPAPDAQYVKFLDRQPLGKVALLGELRRSHDQVSVLQGTRLPPLSGREKDPSRYLLSTTTLMLVRGKPLNVSVFTAYDTPADVEWVRATTARWVDDLNRLNNR